MTQIFIFSEQPDSVQVSESAEHPDRIVRAINRGKWDPYLPYEAIPSRAWQAMRIGSRVLITQALPVLAPPDLILRPRDIQLLQGLGAGLSADQVAWQLHLEVRTVRTITNRLRSLFKASTTPELVAKACALGLIRPDLDSLFD